MLDLVPILSSCLPIPSYVHFRLTLVGTGISIIAAEDSAIPSRGLRIIESFSAISESYLYLSRLLYLVTKNKARKIITAPANIAKIQLKGKSAAFLFFI